MSERSEKIKQDYKDAMVIIKEELKQRGKVSLLEGKNIVKNVLDRPLDWEYDTETAMKSLDSKYENYYYHEKKKVLTIK